MLKFKVEFSNNTTVVSEHELDFPNVEAACEGAAEIANKLRAEGMFTFGFSDWRMTIMNADGKMVGEFPLENTKRPRRSFVMARLGLIAAVFRNTTALFWKRSILLRPE